MPFVWLDSSQKLGLSLDGKKGPCDGSDQNTVPFNKNPSIGNSSLGQRPCVMSYIDSRPYLGWTMRKDYVVAPGKVLMWDPCPLGFPEILTGAHMLVGNSILFPAHGIQEALITGLVAPIAPLIAPLSRGLVWATLQATPIMSRVLRPPTKSQKVGI